MADEKMVKTLDQNPATEPIGHIGWDLWRASHAWKTRFVEAMVAAGYAWFGEARANLLGHLDRAGTRQSDLVARMGTSKQAVQQLLDELTAVGVLERTADPADGRAKWVRLTPAGLALLQAADRAKRRLDADYRRILGPERFAALKAALLTLAEAEQSGRSDD